MKNYIYIVIHELDQEAYICALIASLSLRGNILHLEYDPKDFNSKKMKKDLSEAISSPVPIYIIGDTHLEKIVHIVKEVCSTIHIFSHDIDNSLSINLKKINPNNTYTGNGYIPPAMLGYLNCQITQNHHIRKLIDMLGSFTNDEMRDESNISRGIDVIIDRIVDYELKQQFQMFSVVPINDIIKLGEAEIALDRCIESWEAFGYDVDSDSKSETDSDSMEDIIQQPVVVKKQKTKVGSDLTVKVGSDLNVKVGSDTLMSSTPRKGRKYSAK
jgi:hypothetical protein